MNKLTRKLMISVFTLAFALVTLGATTFACFTLSSITTVEGIDVQIMAGNFMEISADGENYKNLIKWEEITNKGTTENPRMNALTTSNGFDFLEMNYNTNEVKEASGGYVKFNLWVRAQKEGARVYLDEGTTTKSEEKSWVSDADFYYRGEDMVKVNDPIPVYAADALRMSFVSFVEGHATPDAETSNVNIFELDPVDRAGLNKRLDYAIKTDGMLNYWEYKFGSKLVDFDIGEDEAINDTLPTTVLTNADLGAVEGEPNNTLAVLSHQANEDEEYFYGYLTIYLWIEGWDPDAFDAILQGKISVNLQFALAEPEPETP